MKLYHDRTLQYIYNMRHKYINVLTNFVHAMLLTFFAIYFLLVQGSGTVGNRSCCLCSGF